MLSNTSISSNRYPLNILKSNSPSTESASNTTQASTTSKSEPKTQLSPDQVFAAMSSLSKAKALTPTQQAINTLKKPPFSPTDVNLFAPQTYPEATPMEPAAPKEYTADSLKQELTATLKKRFPKNAKAVRQGLAVFSDPKITRVVPDPRLRAAVASLYGTPGQAAIGSIKNGTFKEVIFADMEGPAIAMSVHDLSGATKPSIQVNSRFQHEDFRVIGPTILHETLHSDARNSGREERINHTLDTLVYGKVVSQFPELAQSGTEYTRRMNTRLMGVLNSRNEKGQLRPYTADRGNVFPGGTELANFGAAFTTADGQPLSDSSPGSKTLKKVLEAVTSGTVKSYKFDARTETLINQRLNLFSPVQLVNLAKILKLDTTS